MVTSFRLPIPGSRYRILYWSLWFATLTGLAQALFIFVGRAATGRHIHVSDDVVWMAPVANAAFFGVAGLVLHFATRKLDRSIALGISWAVFVILAGLGPAMIVQKLHPAAAFLLLAGIAIQTGRLVRARAERVDAFIRKTVPVLVAIVTVAGVGQYGVREFRARRAEAALPQTAAGAPNVILIVLDTVRAASLSLYGYGRETSPNLDRLAAGGVTFDHALSTSSWTLPSHATMFTGRLPHEFSADWLTPLDDTHQTLAEALAGEGYATAGFVGNLHYVAASSGLNRGFIRYSDFPRSPKTLLQHSWSIRPLLHEVRLALGDESRLVNKPAADINTEFLSWLDDRPAGRPFFAFLNYFDAHQPYLPPPPFDTRFGNGGPMPDLSRRQSWNQAEIQRSMDAYDGNIAYIDTQLGRLIDDLSARQLLDNTLLVITSDHGELFGEHHVFDHGNSLYRAVLEVPLVIRLPAKIPSGRRVSRPVSLVDLPATILSLAGTSSAASFPGRPLTRYWVESSATPEPESPLFGDISKGINLPPWQPVSKGRMRTVVLDGVQYFLNGDGSEELYDFDHDPQETTNLIDRPEMQAKLAAARRAIGR